MIRPLWEFYSEVREGRIHVLKVQIVQDFMRKKYFCNFVLLNKEKKSPFALKRYNKIFRISCTTQTEVKKTPFNQQLFITDTCTSFLEIEIQ